jgi:hypothetical protein
MPNLERRGESRANKIGPRLVTLGRILFWYADTTTVRLQLALASALWAFALLFDRCEGLLCLGAGKGLRELEGIADLRVWSAMFTLHFATVLWRLIDPVSRPWWAFAINTFGLALWLFNTISIITVLGRLTSGTCLEIVTCFFAAWALIRTDINEEVSTP